MILTVSEFREHVETSLGNAAVQRLLDGAEALIVARAGVSGSITELAGGGYRWITVTRPIGTLTSIIEDYGADDDPVTLAADDYLVFPPGTVIERLSGGTNSGLRWSGRVLVTYTPVDDTAIRKLVQLQLAKLEIAFTPGLAMTVIGSWTEQYLQGKTYPEQQADILNALSPDPQMVVVG